jgi:hypothetical protein
LPAKGKGPLGRPRGRWKDNIKLDVRNVGCGVMDWMNLRTIGKLLLK